MVFYCRYPFRGIQNKKPSNKENAHISEVDLQLFQFPRHPSVLRPPQIQVHTGLTLLSDLVGTHSEPPSWAHHVALSANWGLTKCCQMNGILTPLPQGLAAPVTSLFFFSFTAEWPTVDWSVAPFWWKIQTGPRSRTGTIATRTCRSFSQSSKFPYFIIQKQGGAKNTF